MGALMRAFDWSRSRLGNPEEWPQSLRTAVRLILNTGHPMYIWWGPDGVCLYNDAYSRCIGPERHPSSLGCAAQEVWSEIWDIIGPQIDQVMSGRGATWQENQLVPITRHGRRDDVYWTYSFCPIDDEAAPNGVGGVLVVCTETTQQVLALQRSALALEQFGVDITNRAHADEIAQRLASIVESSDDAIISKDLNGIIKSWNHGAERVFGYSAAEVIGKPITILIPPDHENEESLIIGRIIKGERIEHYETIRQRKDGRLIHVSLTVSPIRDRAGVIVGASKVGRDITASKQDREKLTLVLQEMNHRIKNLFAVASGVVAVSARSAETPKELAGSIQSRLSALARAHDLILPAYKGSEGYAKVSLTDLVRTILSPYDSGIHSISIEGPEFACGRNTSTSLALLMHEFATNSVKYGALSEPSGTVSVSWKIDGELQMNWIESGATITPPENRQGFGGVLVQATVSALGGTISREWSRSGLQITLIFPLERCAEVA
ncbi:MAG: PAS domain S-box protein [Nitrospirota bacterium]